MTTVVDIAPGWRVRHVFSSSLPTHIGATGNVAAIEEIRILRSFII